MPFYYLSFADPKLPEGKQFLGSTVIEAEDEYDVLATATELGRNPGGEIAILELDGVVCRDDLPEEARMYFDRLIPREEVMAWPHQVMSAAEAGAISVCADCND